MKCMMIVKATKDTEAGKMPGEELISAMGKYNEELVKAGVLLDATGLKPSSQSARIQISAQGKRTVIDGPFAETKELIAGYWIIQVKSWEEALEWAKRAPSPHPGEDCYIEVRPYFEFDDFAPSEAVDRARELSKQIEKK